MSETRQAIVALGSNLGDRKANLARALDLLSEDPGVEKVIPSAIYETAPVGVEDQPAFLNMAAGVETRLSPEALLHLLLDTERKMGRVRLVRWGPREIDLDLLFFENEARKTAGLTLPHPRWAERSFVTIPLKDLLSHPNFKRPVWEPLRRNLKDLSPDKNVRKL